MKKTASSPGQVFNRNSDSAKLVSLLALAAGAASMPQVTNADIFVNDFGGNPKHVGFGPGDESFADLPLPGTVHFGFVRHTTTGSSVYGGSTFLVESVTVGAQSTGMAAGVQAKVSGTVDPQLEGAAWPSTPFQSNAIVGLRTTVAHYLLPSNSYDHRYVGFSFNDSTVNQDRFGWIEFGLTIGANTSPRVTIYRFAYDSSGSHMPMGAVPEPALPSLLALGAMAWGAKGVRAWRRNQNSAAK
jgi:hypothetical protein